MAEDASSAAPSPRGCADGRDADTTEEQMAETETNDEEQFECQELLECQVQVGAPEEEEEDAGLVTEAETVAAGWMLDFLCLSLCRAFRDGRSEDFRRTRNSAEAIIHGLSSLTAYQLRTIYICQFLTRIAAGKTLVKSLWLEYTGSSTLSRISESASHLRRDSLWNFSSSHFHCFPCLCHVFSNMILEFNCFLVVV
ncbi:PREDICTED: telomeric repeat-binding factor 1 isoform X2 [Rhinopithecus bieti]|uniref:telomeric repeat-binding factor 1 isoform X2 n=1 Tax=Rhinopithecus bieti TaxID=61621 RepID=UPI00083BEF87|nr:PREDICTED: telomeric repeat-binding factor 1 isoform X2 [Rhinopithecus bieti]